MSDKEEPGSELAVLVGQLILKFGTQEPEKPHPFDQIYVRLYVRNFSFVKHMDVDGTTNTTSLGDRIVLDEWHGDGIGGVVTYEPGPWEAELRQIHALMMSGQPVPQPTPELIHQYDPPF